MELKKDVRLVLRPDPRRVLIAVDLLPEVTSLWAHTASHGHGGNGVASFAASLGRSLETLRAGGRPTPPDLDSFVYSWTLEGDTVRLACGPPMDGIEAARALHTVRVPKRRLEALLAQAVELMQGAARDEIEAARQAATFKPSSPDGFEVAVETNEGANGGGKADKSKWGLRFSGPAERAGKKPHTTFALDSPSKFSLRRWRALATGESSDMLDVFPDGDGKNIAGLCTFDNDTLVFTVDATTAEGDSVEFRTVVPLAAVGPQLSRALDYAASAGLPFAPD